MTTERIGTMPNLPYTKATLARQRLIEHLHRSKFDAAAQDTASLTQIALDVAFAGGAHLAYTDGAFQRFDRTHWTTLSEAQLGRIILPLVNHEQARRQRTPSIIRDIIATLRHATASSSPIEQAEARPIINVANGELWIGSDGAVDVRQHNPASGQRHCSDVVYDPKATCPRFDRAVADIFAASSEPEALIALWHELLGYLLQPVRRRPLILVAAGQGRDGKSALAETLVRLLGRAQVTSMPVEDLNGSRFILGDLAESRVFLDLDMTAGVLLPDGPLKKLSEGTTVTAERKFLDPVTFTMRAVPLLLTNNTPLLADRSNGFRRRLLVLPFERRFTEAEVDYSLFPEIYETELSGVLNRALAGLQRVIQRGWKFDPPEAVRGATGAWWAEATGGVSGPVAPALRHIGGPYPQSSTPTKAIGVRRPRKRDLTASTSNPSSTVSVLVSTTAGSYAVKVQVEAVAPVEVHISNEVQPLHARAPSTENAVAASAVSNRAGRKEGF